MTAANMVYVNNECIRHTTDLLMQCPNWASTWIERFREDGMASLWPPAVGRRPLHDQRILAAGKAPPASVRILSGVCRYEKGRVRILWDVKAQD